MRVLLLFIFFILSCGPSPLHQGSKRENIYVEYSYVNQITKTTAVVNWKCNTPQVGIVLYGIGNFNQSQSTFLSREYQVAVLTNLSPGSGYQYQVFCKEIKLNELNFLFNQISPLLFTTVAPDSISTSIPTTSNPVSTPTPTTSTDPDPIPKAVTRSIIKSIPTTRGIWLLGGIGSNSQPVQQVDLFDPVNLNFIPNITNIPTPRAYAQIVSHKGMIYVIGGMTGASSNYVVSNLVEEYNPSTATWTTKTSMPSFLQGGVIGSVGEEIVLIAGTTTTDMTTGTILNTVYKFRPDAGTNGTWSAPFTSANSIFARVDMGGCVIQGNLFFTGGRLYTDGSLLATTDAYVTASNATTSILEASLNLARSGTATACYRPSGIDTYPLDTAGILVVGGTTFQNVFQPPTSIAAANNYEFMQIGTGFNVFNTGPSLPTAVYAPAMEVSYEKRRAYVFGGATSINLPTTTIYSIDLSNPTAGPWATETVTMPVARFGHKAVIINR